MSTSHQENYEDILNDSLEFLGGQRVVDSDVIRYGPLRLTVASKSGKANTLLADHLFSPSLFLAERIERGLLQAAGQTVVELGAGCALPSLLLASSPSPPSLVLATDYPDDNILGNLKNNVERNFDAFQEACTVRCAGYDWGTGVEALRHFLNPPATGFDVMILSDLLHFDQCHDVLISSIVALLARTSSARVHVSAGNYTRPEVCEHFIHEAENAGLVFEVPCDINGNEWLGNMEVSGLDKEQLATRKDVCRYWIGRWTANL